MKATKRKVVQTMVRLKLNTEHDDKIKKITENIDL